MKVSKLLRFEGPTVNSHGRETVLEAQEETQSAEGAALRSS
jgi:hypothetical protein